MPGEAEQMTAAVIAGLLKEYGLVGALALVLAAIGLLIWWLKIRGRRASSTSRRRWSGSPRRWSGSRPRAHAARLDRVMRCAIQDTAGLYILLASLVGLIIGGWLGDRVRWPP